MTTNHRGAGRVPRRTLISLEAASQYADVSERTVRRWITSGRLTGYRVGVKLLRVDVDELDTMIAPVPVGVTGRAPSSTTAGP